MLVTHGGEKLWCEVCDMVQCTTHIHIGAETPLGYTNATFAVCAECCKQIGLDLVKVEKLSR